MVKIKARFAFLFFWLVSYIPIINSYRIEKPNWTGCLSHHEVQEIMKLKPDVDVNPVNSHISIDLGRSFSAVVLTSEGLCNHDSILLASWDELEEMIEKAIKGKPGCYALYDDGCKPWRISTLSKTSGNPVSLCPPHRKSGAPTMVIGGFTMHRLSGDDMDPVRDTMGKVDCLQLIQGLKVLDTCMGLGYTAIESARRVASPSGDPSKKQVITIEYDDASVEMCLHNPWSRELFDDSLPIEILRGDSCQIIKTFPDSHFDAIIHDPPARALCRSELYGLQFYKELRRVLRPQGKLYHYIGNPQSNESGTLYSGIINRLQDAGFSIPNDYKYAFGILAIAKTNLKKGNFAASFRPEVTSGTPVTAAAAPKTRRLFKK